MDPPNPVAQVPSTVLPDPATFQWALNASVAPQVILLQGGLTADDQVESTLHFLVGDPEYPAMQVPVTVVSTGVPGKKAGP